MDAKLLARACAMPLALATLWAPHLTTAMARWKIDTPARQAMFLAQCAHESASFTTLEENLNYSAEALSRTWPNRYAQNGKPNELALRIARKPRLIASYTYANRMGNGDPESGHGWLFRGRGPIGITGQDMYLRAGKAIGVDLVTNPDLATDPAIGAQIAAWIWIDKGCNAHADRGDIEASTRAINGGLIGLPDRRSRWLVCKREMGVS